MPQFKKKNVPASVNKKLNLEQEKADKLLIEISETVNKSKFGKYVILNTSFVVLKASAMKRGVPCTITSLT